MRRLSHDQGRKVGQGDQIPGRIAGHGRAAIDETEGGEGTETMSRYFVVKEKSTLSNWWEALPQPLPHPTVTASEAMETGILDKDGNKIMRAPDAIGFLRVKP